MKTYVYHNIDRANGKKRIEIKEPYIRVIGEEPRNPVERIPLSPIMPAVDWELNSDEMISSAMPFEVMAFEHVRLSTFIWQQDHCDNETSFGHYDRIDSYACVPFETDFDGAFMYERGTDIYGYLNTVPLTGAQEHIIREKMQELEHSLKKLENRPILPERELENMRRDLNWVDRGEQELPRRLREYDYFENNNDEFTVE